MTLLARRSGCILAIVAAHIALVSAGAASAQSRRVPVEQDIRQYERLERDIDRDTRTRRPRDRDLGYAGPNEGVQGFSPPGFLDNDPMDNGPMPPGAMVDEDID